MISPPRSARIAARFTALLVPFALLAGTALHAAQPLRIGGTGSAIGTFARIAEAYAHANPAAPAPTIVPNLGSGGALRALTAGAIEIALVSRPMTAEDKAAGLVALQYGRSPFVLIANGTGMPDLTTARIAEIVTGHNAVRPDGTPIRFVFRPATDGDTRLLASFSAATADALKLVQKRPGVIVAITDQEAVHEALRLPGGMTATTLSLLLSEDRRAAILPVDGRVPSVRAITDGSYPWAKTFWIVTLGSPTGNTLAFIEFVRSPRGRSILESTGHQVLP